jgi:hypothetical protein
LGKLPELLFEALEIVCLTLRGIFLAFVFIVHKKNVIARHKLKLLLVNRVGKIRKFLLLCFVCTIRFSAAIPLAEFFSRSRQR